MTIKLTYHLKFIENYQE